MKTSKSSAELFQTLRDLPEAFSKKQVQQIIVGLPLLPVPNSWFSIFNFKSILMIALPISLVIGTLVFWSPTEAVESISQQVDTEKIMFVHSTEETGFSTPQNPTTPEINSRVLLSALEPIPIIETNTYWQDVYQIPKVLDSIPNTTIRRGRVVTGSAASVGTGRLYVDGRVEIQNTGIGYADSLDTKPIDITINEVKALKRWLYRNLVNDNLIRSKRKEAVIEYHSKTLVLNGEAIDSGTAAKYLAKFESLDMEPGPHREIRLSPRYIIVGDNDGYFTGTASGRNMELNFQNCEEGSDIFKEGTGKILLEGSGLNDEH